MLEELKNINYSLTKDNIIFFLCDVIGDNTFDVYTIDIICSHAPGSLQLSSKSILLYATALGWVVSEEEKYYLSDKIKWKKDDKQQLLDILIKDLFVQLMDMEIINIEMFTYETNSDRIRFKNELLSLEYSSIRNSLINLGIFEIIRFPLKTSIYVSDEYKLYIGEKIKSAKNKD